MRTISTRSTLFLAGLAVMFIGLPPSDVHGQRSGSNSDIKGSCNSYSYSSTKNVSHTEQREFELPASGSLSIDGGKNGGIAVRSGDVSQIRVTACVSAHGATEAEARSVAGNIRINTSGTIYADSSDPDAKWSVNYVVTVPRNTNLSLRAQNGGISIAGVEGEVEFETANGGVSVVDAAGNVRGRTTNGGVSVRLTGSAWRGSGLDVTTVNGGVNLSIPSGYAASIETGTVNGGFKSDFPELAVTTTDRYQPSPKRVAASINGGGASIRVVTTNGGITIKETSVNP